MHKIEIFNVGNGDSALVSLAGGRLMMVDFCDRVAAQDTTDPRIHLGKRIKEILASKSRDSIDVLAITHLDKDHIAGASAFFHFDHAAKYQGGERVKMKMLWVPAGALFETELDDDARVIQAEARHRLRQGTGVRIFSRPEALRDWCSRNDIDFDARQHLMTDAGRCAPEFPLSDQEMEIFIHAPLARRINGTSDGALIDRNQDCLVFQARFKVSGDITDVLFTGDMTADGWEAIIDATVEHGNEARLDWDLYNVPHHCSYKSVGPEKGADETVPTDHVKWLLETRGRANGAIVSSSNPTPEKGTIEDRDDQPPHRQAATYYKRVTDKLGGKFKVTMQEPTAANPKPLIIEISRAGLKFVTVSSVAATIASSPIPRAG